MPRNLAEELIASVEEHYVVLGRTIYAVRRVNSDQLRHQGWATLEGSSSARAALAEAQERAEELQARSDGMTPEELAEAQRQVAAQRESYWRAMVGRPEGAEAMLSRSDAYICAAVVGAGALRDDLPAVGCEVLTPDQAPEVVAQDLRTPEEIASGSWPDPVYLVPQTFVRELVAEDAAQRRTWVHRLSTAQRTTLGTAIAQLQEVASEVAPFRRLAGPRRPALAAHGGDGDPPARAAAHEPVGDGSDPVVQGRSRKGDRRARQEREAGVSRARSGPVRE